MILNKKTEKLGKSEPIYHLLTEGMNKKYTEYLLNIWDMKGQDDTIDLALSKEILFFEDSIVIISKKDYAMFINLNHVLAIDLCIKSKTQVL